MSVPMTERSLGELAVAIPGATALFRRHKLDFCCGGGASLAEAAASRALDPGQLQAELAALPSGAPDLPETPDALVALIVSRYHDAHRRDLPELIKLARKVEAVHRGKPGTPAGVADVLTRMEAELLSHMAKEEMILFPVLAAGADGPGAAMAAGPIARMRAEHDECGEDLREIARLTAELALPEGACTTFRALYAGLARFEEELTTHIHIENNILFPMFESGAAPGFVCPGMGAGR
ncbi:MAG: iron-sulfur cluster repair di-iron protein [Rhodospirillales bacterium]|nr:iron-sulfur cluster repair di-iron protein [Rhodospirillales bacterium]